MRIEGKIVKKKAILITPEHLNQLSEILKKFCETLTYSCIIESNSKICFSDIDELLAYDNFKARKIKSLIIKGYSGCFQCINIKIGEEYNFSVIQNYNETVECTYEFNSFDDEALFCSVFDTWFEKCKSRYWLLGKISLFGIVWIYSIFMTIVNFIKGYPTLDQASNRLIILSVGGVVLICLCMLWALKLFDKHIIANLFPPTVFLWGEEISRYKRWEKLRSNLLWSVIVALIIGVAAALFYDLIAH